MYQALYRKYRPRTFEDVSGQTHVTDTLRRQVESGRLSHAYLFVGTRGTGKTTCAKILAKAVNCEHPVNGEPCNKCPTCLGIDDGSILDVVEMDAASNNGVDNVRALRDEAVFSPAAAKKRVYIVDEVHMLSGSAFNALLKILEEPPEHLMFILATTELHKVPATILSRCQRFSFKRLSREIIAERLGYVASREGIELTDGAASMLARLADGAMRDGLSLLDQCSGAGTVDESRVMDVVGLAGSGNVASLLEYALNGNASEAMELLDRLYNNGKDMDSLLREITQLIRDILILTVAKNSAVGLLSGSFDAADLKRFSSYPATRLFQMSDIIDAASAEMSRSSNRRISAELCIMRMCDPAFGGGDSALNARITKLEMQMSNIGSVPVAVSAKAEPDDEPPFDIPEKAEKPQKPAPKKKEADPTSVEEAVPGGLWSGIIAHMQSGEFDPALMLMSDDSDISADLDGDVLTVTVKNETSFGILNRPAMLDKLRASASAVVGRTVIVKMTSGESEPEAKKSKLDYLHKFGNVEFK